MLQIPNNSDLQIIDWFNFYKFSAFRLLLSTEVIVPCSTIILAKSVVNISIFIACNICNINIYVILHVSTFLRIHHYLLFKSYANMSGI